MPRKKGHRSGTPDGYAPSPLGETPSSSSSSLVGATDNNVTPAGVGGGGGSGGTDDDSPMGMGAPPRVGVGASAVGVAASAGPVPSWSGVNSRMPCEEPRGAVLEAVPVATGIGANVHALLSPKLMVAAGLGAGDWVAIAITDDDDGGGGGALLQPHNNNSGGTPGTRGSGTPVSSAHATGTSTPRTPSSRGGGGGGGVASFRSPSRGGGGAASERRPPEPDAAAALLPALLARNVALDAHPGDAMMFFSSGCVGGGDGSGDGDGGDGGRGGGGDSPGGFTADTARTDATLAAAAAAVGAAALGRYTVLAQVHPNPTASSAHAVSLARKVWMSLGSPSGGAGVHIYPLNKPRPTHHENNGDGGGDGAPGDSGDLSMCLAGRGRLGGCSVIRAPTAGAQCGAVTLRLWAIEQKSAGGWLERGLEAGGAGVGPRQLAVLEALARRALNGRALLPGNLARLPLLGVSAYFQVEEVDGKNNNNNTGGGGGGGGAGDGSGVVGVVCEATAIKLLPRGGGLADSIGDSVGFGFGGGSKRMAIDDDDDDYSSDGDDEECKYEENDDDDDNPGAAAARRAMRAARRIGGGGGGTAAAVAAGAFDQLGGVGEHAAALRELVELPLRRPDLFEACGVRPPRGVLLWGPPGTGKTRLARAAAVAAGATLMVVRGPELIGAHVGESEAALKGVFVAATAAAPCVVLLDEIDALAPARAGGDGLGGRGNDSGGGGGAADESMSARVVAALLSIMDGAGADNDDTISLHRVVVVATTNRPEAVDRALRRPGRFDREIEVGVPTPAGRREIIATHLRRLSHNLKESEIDELSAGAHGFVGADVAALCQAAAMSALRRRITANNSHSNSSSSNDADALADGLGAISLGGGGSGGGGDAPSSSAAAVVTMADFVAARVRVRPSALREVGVEVPKVDWDDVGGLGDVKQRLQEAVEWSERHPEAMHRMGAKPPKGILLYGPPGCSKTMLARAVASASGRNFLTVKGPELYSKWVGDSEKAVRALFARAKASAPSVIFLDELDGLVGQRSTGAQGGEPSVHDRLLTQLLSEMDGLQTNPSSSSSSSSGGSSGSSGIGGASKKSKNDGVAVVAATNRPDLVDPALLRPGRFDRLLFIPPPATSEDRMEILKTRLKHTPLGDDVDLRMLAMATAGYTGADLAAVCREAALAALEEDLGSTAVSARHFTVATGRVPPSPPPPAELSATYDKFKRPGAGLTAV